MTETKTVPQIVDMDNEEIATLLERVNFGHLGVCSKNRPYVVPIHFAYERPYIYFYTTEGLKTEIIDENPTICLQIEEIKNRENWQSVIFTGPAVRLENSEEIEKAKEMVKEINPKFTPAWSIRWLDDWVRSNVEVLYRIDPEMVSGRRAYSVNVH